jgi:ABC-2 type transport system permease protein
MEFIVPGLIMMSIINNSYSNVVSSFYGAKFGRHIEEILVSPTPNSIILLGYLSGGVIRGIVVGAVVACLAWFFSPIHLAHPLLMLLVVILTSTLFSLAGFINAIFAQKFDDISWVPTFVLTPLTYLGGVFYSVKLLSPFWQKISLFNPILYMVDAFRYSTLGISDISIVFTIGLIAGLTALMYAIAYTLLVKGIGIRA